MKINNFVIDRVLRGIMTSTADGSYMWSINQVQEPSLNVTSETAEAVDALGSRIATFNRGKSAEFTANNSIFDLGVFAAQNGVDVQEAGVGSAISTPKFDEIVIDGTSASYDLAETPNDELGKIYKLNGDGTLGTAYEKGAAASSTKYAYDESTNKLTPPTGLSAGDRLMVMYEYDATTATYVTLRLVSSFLRFLVLTFVTPQLRFTLTLSSLTLSWMLTLISVSQLMETILSQFRHSRITVTLQRFFIRLSFPTRNNMIAKRGAYCTPLFLNERSNYGKT